MDHIDQPSSEKLLSTSKPSPVQLGTLARTMNCPACQSAMVTENFGGVSVDVCQEGCKGMWFDWMELRKLEDKNAPMTAALQEALTWPEKSNAALPPLKCPKCGEQLHRHLAEDDKQVTLDECYEDGGFFLASGELNDIREHRMSEQDEQAYSDKLANGLPEYVQAESDLQRDEARAEAIRHWTRYLRLSYYATGQ